MPAPRVTIWAEAPKLAIPNPPAILFDVDSLLVVYETIEGIGRGIYAAVQFDDVIDHRLSPINDEGMGKHPYARSGLQWYSFNEVSDSKEILEWAILRPRHWVVTFKDNTLDVLASSAKVVTRSTVAPSARAALFSIASLDEKNG